ncbi:hypothetical protein [Henriciella aquimarina]|uniref:hypothetical protein n=1 Tax=Henriciella aquimarina TaxID=545261 RepID=UPI000A0174D0|nr:hypothetical protein [Henriciella aquimarina]
MPGTIRQRWHSLFEGRFRRAWFLLASAGLNIPLFWILANVPRAALTPPTPRETIIPVTLVEPPAPPPAPEPPEPPPEEPPAPEEKSAQPAPPEPAASPAPEETPPPPDETSPAKGLTSPVIAAPGETADAAPSAGDETAFPELDFPMPSTQEDKTVTALRAFRCNQYGKDRPDFCSDEADAIEAPAPPAFAEEPDMAPKEWARFALERPDPAVQRIIAEGCPPQDGVIQDVFTGSSNPNLQGAAGMVGMLAGDSGSGLRCD